MFLTTWADTLNSSFQSLFFGLVDFIPNLIVAIIIFVVGWLIGAGLGRVVAQVISSLRVDAALRAAGVEKVMERAGFKLNSGAFLGMLVKWFFIVVFLVAALDVLGLTQVTIFLRAVVLGYLPQVIVAVLILLVAAVVADAAQRVVSGAAATANMRSANLLGSIARWSIWIFAVLAALNQLQVATGFVQTLFTGVVVAVALALGLSFGLGGQASAAKFLDKMREEIK
ncbi:MAG: Small-conductance mechanosensitive ion channel-like protein [Parcubacteria bacterium C7867-001]|nr:MAG: Small-conductance mechanosensitive ion channel-like protein [Parcubacteria bacterium C7867-001]